MDTAQLGDALRRRRHALHLDQLEVAELAQVSVRYLRDLEHGKPTAQLRGLLSVLHVLGLRLELVPDTTRG